MRKLTLVFVLFISIFFNLKAQESSAPQSNSMFSQVDAAEPPLAAQSFTNGMKLSKSVLNVSTGTTKINYEIQNNSNVFMEIYDASGKMIINADEGNKTAGYHYIMLDSTKLPRGTYYYTLVANGKRFSKKMIVE